MRFPRPPIGLKRTLLGLAILALNTAPAQGDPLVRKQNDRVAQKISLVQDEAPLGAPQSPDEKSAQPEFWIGVQCEETGSLLRAQLNIDGGLSIGEIAENTPAQKAGLQIHDLILTINDEPLGSVAELQQFVQASQGFALDIGIMRGGKNTTVSVKPELRPRCDELDPIVLTMGFDEELDEKELEKLQNSLKSRPGAPHRQLLLIRPALLLEKEPNNDSSTPNDRSKKAKTPNGAELHFKVKNIEEEAVLVEWAELEKGQLLSGCCQKLLRVIGEQIEINEEKLQKLRKEKAAILKRIQQVAEPAQGDEDSAELARLDRIIEILTLNLETLKETRAMLKAKIDERPKSNSEESDPGQSKRYEFRLRNWS